MADNLPVPESEKRVLENLLRDLNETYPDKVKKNLGRDHKKWDEKVTRLYKNIGYGNRNEFLAQPRSGPVRHSFVNPWRDSYGCAFHR